LLLTTAFLEGENNEFKCKNEGAGRYFGIFGIAGWYRIGRENYQSTSGFR
jgi:hypothetical protein